ncbi:hypothetical protein V8C86DRAFT_2483117 [Haematococcus lacustris]
MTGVEATPHGGDMALHDSMLRECDLMCELARLAGSLSDAQLLSCERDTTVPVSGPCPTQHHCLPSLLTPLAPGHGTLLACSSPPCPFPRPAPLPCFPALNPFPGFCCQPVMGSEQHLMCCSGPSFGCDLQAGAAGLGAAWVRGWAVWDVLGCGTRQLGSKRWRSTLTEAMQQLQEVEGLGPDTGPPRLNPMHSVSIAQQAAWLLAHAVPQQLSHVASSGNAPASEWPVQLVDPVRERACQKAARMMSVINDALLACSTLGSVQSGGIGAIERTAALAAMCKAEALRAAWCWGGRLTGRAPRSTDRSSRFVHALQYSSIPEDMWPQLEQLTYC